MPPPRRWTEPGIMYISFPWRDLLTSQRAPRTDPACEPDRPRQAPQSLINWRTARLASRACCCPARPMFIAVIPPSPGRRLPTDLLLCGHHYRASKRSLAVAGAVILDMDGFSVEPDYKNFPMPPATSIDAPAM